MISHPNPSFTVRKLETKPPSGGPRIRVASFIPKSLRNTPRSGNHQHQGLLFQEEGVLMMVYQEKILPPGSLPVLASEPPDVLLSQRTWPWMLVWIAAVAVIFGLVGAPLIHLIR